MLSVGTGSFVAHVECVLKKMVEVILTSIGPGTIIQGGSNMTGTDFFFVTIAHHSSNSQTGLNRF